MRLPAPPPKPPTLPLPLLRIEDVADRLAISRSMAWKLQKVGAFKTIRVGRALRVTPAELDRYIASLVDGS